MRSFTDIFIRHPVLAAVVNLVIVLVGARAVFSLPVQQFPKLDSASIERVVSAIGGVDHNASESRAAISPIPVRLKLSCSARAALAETRARLRQVRSELPSEAEPPMVEIQRADRPYASFYSSFTSP